MGLVDNLVVFERETYEVFITDLTKKTKNYSVYRAVRLNLKDYKGEERHVDLVKVKHDDGTTVLIVSEMMSYQSHVPF